MGASYSNQARRMDELLDSQESLLVAYKRHEALISENFEASRFNRTVDALRGEFVKQLNLLPDDALMQNRENYIGAIQKELALFASRDLGSLWYFVRRAVCNVFFPHTNALRVLTKIDEVAERMPEASVQIASYHATIEILVDWLWEQITVTKLA